jgi:MscS family membrane protein
VYARGRLNTSMKKSLRYCVLIIFSSFIVAAYGQPAAKENGKTPAHDSEQTHEAAPEPGDPLGRSTPHGTLVGFLHSAQGGKYKEAAQYLQLSKMERAGHGEGIARQLHDVMDEAFVGRVGAVSDTPEGSPQSGVPQDRERIGAFRIGDKETSVDLVHVSDPTAGHIWLFSSKTLAAVPEFYGQIENSRMESKLPRFLVTEQVLSTPLWRWIALLLLIPLALALAWATVGLLRAGLRILMRWRPYPVLQDLRGSIGAPAKLILTVLFHRIGVVFLGLPLLFRDYYGRFVGIIVVVGLAWLVVRLVNCWAERERVNALEGSGYRSGSIVLLGQRILNVVVVVVAVMSVLSILGFNMTTAVAGLGIGSLAVAFAAQKTLENLLGGVSILGDQVIRVGETCRIGDKLGTVEDISLRSTRIRTVESTELSVPNGQLATMSIENLSRYERNSFRTTIGLQHETSPDQMRAVLKEIQALLSRHPKVDPNVARVRLIGFGESSLDVQIHCHVLTGVWTEFLAIREELLLQIMDAIAGAGTALALPSRTLFVQDQGSDQKHPAAAEQNVQEHPFVATRRRNA